MQSNKMSDRLDSHFGEATTSMSIRQTRRGCFQEILLGCEARDEFKWFNTTDGTYTQFATSLEDSNCCMRICCGGCHEFSMEVKEENSGAEILSLERPMACNMLACKCCCYQSMTFSSGGRALGKIEEKFWCCVPRMIISDYNGRDIYKVHQPTCCGGMCVNCCAEGNPCCGRGCCKVPFHIFPADQVDTDNGAFHAGKILKLPKSMAVELLTDAQAFDISFPKDATAEQKALIAGSTIFINANFFEADSDANAYAG